MVLTEEQQGVIDEFLLEAKSKAEAKQRGEKLRIIKVDEFFKRLLYDSTLGRDRSKELLVNYILHMKANDPTNENIELLEMVIPKHTLHTWVTETEYKRQFGPIPYDKIAYDGFGYYTIGGIRIDAEDADNMYKEERDAFNTKKKNNS